MKTKVLNDGRTKVWFDREEEFFIVEKNQDVIDKVIDMNLDGLKYTRQLVKEVDEGGFSEINYRFQELNEMFPIMTSEWDENKLKNMFYVFNSVFKTEYRYQINDNGTVSVETDMYPDYETAKGLYFGNTLLKLFASSTDIV